MIFTIFLIDPGYHLNKPISQQASQECKRRSQQATWTWPKPMEQRQHISVKPSVFSVGLISISQATDSLNYESHNKLKLLNHQTAQLMCLSIKIVPSLCGFPALMIEEAPRKAAMLEKQTGEDGPQFFSTAGWMFQDPLQSEWNELNVLVG